MANDQRDDEGPGIDWFTPWTHHWNTSPVSSVLGNLKLVPTNEEVDSQERYL